MDANAAVTPVALTPASAPLSLEQLEAGLPAHPRWRIGQERLALARTQVQAARAERIQDWEVGLLVERDVYDGREDEATTLALRVPVPLWDRRSGAIRAAHAETDRASAEQQVVERDLRAALRNAHAHLGHLIEQAEHHRSAVLEPARRVFELSGIGFAAGEVELLTLIDATDTYFEERERRLELLYAGRREATALSLAAGHSLLDATNPPRGD
jgi:cobalt-zinc-cadmium efflux system outer membrane protein